MIKKETIQNIIDASKIEEVVGDFVSLKKRGVNYIGLCPFHVEKTPSFTVSPAKGFYHCFGCGKGGGPVDFVMQHEHFTYPEALKYLAEKYHIEIVEEIQSEEDKQLQSEIESLFHIVAFAQKHFTDNLHNTEEGKAIGLTYFSERGFNKDVVKKFQLGFSPEKWDDFSYKAIQHGYKIDYLIKTGLTIQKEDKSYYDRFRDRVIFPVHNLSGRVIGFSARILTSDKNKPKYINSPESEIYNKGKTLYGIFFAKNSIVAQNNCFLVEGNTDVIALYQAGIENVVASSGTALTTDQIRLIKKFTPNITILYDGDEAGIKASLRGIDLILEEGLNVKVVMFPAGEDPDSFVRKNDPSAIKSYIKEKAANFILYKTQLLLEETKNDPIKKAELIKEIVRTISLLPEPIHRNIYIKECSEILKVQEQSLWNELNRVLRKKFKKDIAQNNPENKSVENFPDEPEYYTEKQIISNPFDSIPHEQHLLWLMMNFGHEKIFVEVPMENFPGKLETKSLSVAEYVRGIMQIEDFEFTEPESKAIFSAYMNLVESNEKPDLQSLINHNDKTIAEKVIHILKQKYELSIQWEKKYKIYTPVHEDEDQNVLLNDISATLNAIQLKRISVELARIEEEIKTLQKRDENYEDDLMILLDEFQKKQNIKARISAKLGRVIN